MSIRLSEYFLYQLDPNVSEMNINGVLDVCNGMTSCCHVTSIGQKDFRIPDTEGA